MSVQVHRMRYEREVIVDNEADSAIRAKIVDVPRDCLAKIDSLHDHTMFIPIRLWIQLSLISVQQQCVVVIATESRVVDRPDKVSAVVDDIDVKLLSSNRAFGVRRDREQRRRHVQRIIGASLDLIERDIRGRVRHSGIPSVLVVDDSQCVWRNTIGKRATCWASWAKLRTHPVCAVRVADGFYDNLSTLRHAKRNNVRRIWLNRHKVLRNNSEGVIVDAEFLHAIGTGVDQPKQVLLAFLEEELA